MNDCDQPEWDEGPAVGGEVVVTGTSVVGGVGTTVRDSGLWVGRCSDTAAPTARATCSLTRARIVAMSSAGVGATVVTGGCRVVGGGALSVGGGGGHV